VRSRPGGRTTNAGATGVAHYQRGQARSEARQCFSATGVAHYQLVPTKKTPAQRKRGFSLRRCKAVARPQMLCPIL